MGQIAVAAGTLCIVVHIHVTVPGTELKPGAIPIVNGAGNATIYNV